MTKRASAALDQAKLILNRLRARLGLYELAVTGHTVEVIEPPPPEDAVAHLHSLGRIDDDEASAARRFLMLRRAVIGREHPRALNLARIRAGAPAGPNAGLQWAYEQASLALRDAGADAERATRRLLVDNLMPRDRGDLELVRLGLDALALHFAELDYRRRRR